MKIQTEAQTLFQIRLLIVVFIICLVLSGITAFPIETELEIAMKHISIFPEEVQHWLSCVYTAVHETNLRFPFISYGTDWLAFAHIVIATVFIGPLRDPIKNIWVIQFGMIACLLVFPLAFIAGPIRGIPLYWRLIDCSFGVIGFLPLYYCYRKIRRYERQIESKKG